jgi:hypothetical protein
MVIAMLNDYQGMSTVKTGEAKGLALTKHRVKIAVKTGCFTTKIQGFYHVLSL